MFSGMVAERLANAAAAVGESVEYECVRADQLQISFCRGCEGCFQTCICPLDRTDSFGILKQKMLEADILLFCTPVYTGAMSGPAKTVLDRLGYWTHREELAGKTTAVLVTTSNNHGDETTEQLVSLLRVMGAAVAYAGCVSRHIGRVNLNLPEQLNPELDRTCERLLDCRRDPSAYITETQDRSFAAINRQTRQGRVLTDLTGIKPKREMIVWEERGFLDYHSLSDYVRRNGPLTPGGGT